jgi:hypothetical protein
LEEIVAQQVAKDTGLEVVKGWAIALHKPVHPSVKECCEQMRWEEVRS